MNLDDLSEFEGWVLIEDGSPYEAELQKEIPASHVLAGVPVTAVARRVDRDDFLFVTLQAPSKVAFVHLTWSIETDPAFPHTVLYETWEDFFDDCRLDPY